MLTVFDLAYEDTSLKRKSTNERSGPCPNTTCRCQHDGFNIKMNDDHEWVFMCRGCWDSEEFLEDRDRKRGWGNELQYLMHFRGMKYSKALAFLVTQGNLTLEEAVGRLSKMEPDQARALLMRLGASQDEAETEKPQKRIQRHSKRQASITDIETQKSMWRALEDSIKLLRSEAGQEALNYLLMRGITDEVIEDAHLGFSLKGGIPRLIIPSINGRRIVAIYRRDLRPDVPHDERWKDAPGSLDSELYLADCLSRKDKPVVLVESALDALSIIVACGYELVNVVATGGIKKCRNPLVLAKLARMPHVFVAFDADKQGDEGAKWWLDRLTNASRLRPLLKDINDMLVDNWDIQEWIEEAITNVIVNQAIQFDNPLCGVCLESNIETPALPDDYEGSMYCREHHPMYCASGAIPVYQMPYAEYMVMVVQQFEREQQKKAKEEKQQVRERIQAKHKYVQAG